MHVAEGLASSRGKRVCMHMKQTGPGQRMRSLFPAKRRAWRMCCVVPCHTVAHCGLTCMRLQGRLMLGCSNLSKQHFPHFVSWYYFAVQRARPSTTAATSEGVLKLQEGAALRAWPSPHVASSCCCC